MNEGYFILVMIPGKGKHSKNKNSEKIYERVPK